MSRLEGGVEVRESVGGLSAADVVLVAEPDDRVGESCALLGGVDLFVNVGERVPAPVGVVVLDRFAQAFEVGADQLGEGGRAGTGRLLGRSIRPSERSWSAGSDRPARSGIAWWASWAM